MDQIVDLDLLQRFDPLALSPLIENQDYFYYFIKRAMDLILTIFLLILFFPIMILIAILIAIDSQGPIIFCQKRIGAQRWIRSGFSYWQRTEFTCYKFRTMFHNADPSLHQDFVTAFVTGDIEQSNKTETTFKLHEDPRVTRVGKVLRKTSLDELPQFINILRGEMSLVGPRPDVPYAVKHYKTWQNERLAALPGLTGLWQTTARSNVAFDEMARLDIEYVRSHSLLMDLKILLLTLPAVLSGKGAC